MGESTVSGRIETRPETRSVQLPAAPYKPNAVLRWVYRRFFSHIHVDERWSAAVRDAAERGVVVYIMRSLSFLDFLCLDWLVKRFGLPLVRFVNDLGLWILEPFGKGGRRLRFRRQVPEDEALAQTVGEGHSALLFLRRPPRLGRPRRRGEKLNVDLLRTLVTMQRKMEKPILLLPQTFVWTKLPPKPKRTWVDLFFGPAEWPGKVRVFFQFLLNYRNALLRSGEPFDLGAFVESQPDLDDDEVADKVRYALLRRIERERAVVLGPTSKTPTRIREELLRSPRVRKHIDAAVRTTGKSITKVEREAKRELRKLCAAQDPHALGLLHRALDWIWHRIYDGLEVDKEGLERVREAARRGSLVYLPSHKSHVDYLVLSDVLYRNALSAPLIAAGENLSFWPLGPLLRRGGGFFIRRTFKGRKLYAALVDAYLRKLLVEGFPIEFFLEGGRSRTGKLLSPKFGLLSMIVDAALTLRGKETFFVPISIGYERIVEERSYVHELSGGDKQKENIGGLLKTPRVLRSRYGRLYVQFGEILSFHKLVGEFLEKTGAGGEDDELLRPAQRRMLVQTLGHRVVYEIDRATVVTPAALLATVLLVHRRRGIAHSELVGTARLLLDTLDRIGARVASTIRDDDGQIRGDTLQEAIRLFSDAKLLTQHGEGEDAIYAVPEERRIALEYYKNNILHFFVPSCLISSVIPMHGTELASKHLLRERVQQLSRLFKYEFMYRADAPFDAIFEEALTSMLDAKELERIAEHVRAADGPRGEHIAVYAAILRSYFESYRLALRGVALLLDGSLSRKDWLKQTLAIGQRLYLAGEIELRESLSRPKLDNALLAFRDLGVVRFEDEDILSRGEQLHGKEEVDELDRKFAMFLRAT